MNLDEVTICSIDCIHPRLAVNAMEKSIKNINFKERILFTDIDFQHDQINTIKIPAICSLEDYNKFVFKKLHDYINTEYLLIIHWDGWVIDHTKWDSDFLNYDYIGAPWGFYDDGYVVGNGGFCLRTRRLQKILQSPELNLLPTQAEDDAICRSHRDYLEKNHNIKFAPYPLAQKFSYESETPQGSTFGFHGAYNLWRHCNDEEIIEIFKTIKTVSPKKLDQRSYFEVIMFYYQSKKFAVLRELYNLMKDAHGVNLVGDGVFGITKNYNFTADFIKICEAL